MSKKFNTGDSKDLKILEAKAYDSMWAFGDIYNGQFMEHRKGDYGDFIFSFSGATNGKTGAIKLAGGFVAIVMALLWMY